MIDKFRGKYMFLSNFEPCKIVYKGRVFSTVEHAFQAAKCLDETEMKLFCFVDTPAEAKKWGRQVKLRPDWESVKLDVMYEFVKQKFSKTKFKELLLDTGDELIVEGNNHKDTFWGVYNGVGENNLGKIIMRVREEIKNETND